jgi:hypothetical protein
VAKKIFQRFSSKSAENRRRRKFFGVFHQKSPKTGGEEIFSGCRITSLCANCCRPGQAGQIAGRRHGMACALNTKGTARYARRGFGCATPSGAGRLQRVSWVSQRTGGSRSGSATLSRRLGDGSQPRSSKVRKVQWGAHHAVQCRTGLRRRVVTLLHPLWGLIPPPVLGTLPSTPSSSFPA